MMHVPLPRDAALDWVKRALNEELRDDPSIPTRAENLVAIAEHFDERVETLIRWIHTPARGKQWTAAEFRRFCELRERQRPERPRGFY
jgi:hypothetical protein